MSFVNESGIIGQVLAAGTQNLTGSIVATLLIILVLCFVVSIMFDIPLEFFAIIILPLCLAMGAYYSTFMVPITVILIYLAAIFTKNWLFK